MNKDKNRRVIFKNIIKVHLIHSNYNNNTDKLQLWWSGDDFYFATKNANDEINRLMTIHPSMERKYALKLLYQPNNISYDPDNF